MIRQMYTCYRYHIKEDYFNEPSHDYTIITIQENDSLINEGFFKTVIIEKKTVFNH